MTRFFVVLLTNVRSVFVDVNSFKNSQSHLLNLRNNTYALAPFLDGLNHENNNVLPFPFNSILSHEVHLILNKVAIK